MSQPPTTPTRKRRPVPLVSLSGACAYFRNPRSGNPPSRGNLSYHLETGALKPDKKTALPTGGFVYGFKRSTLQDFARSVGWTYVPKQVDE